MKNYSFFLILILFSSCVSKKKYNELLNRNCEAESENILRNLRDDDILKGLNQWRNLEKKCGETSENYYLCGATLYHGLSYRVINNDSLGNKYLDTSLNLFKEGIAKLDSAPNLKLNYALLLKEKKSISNFEFYSLVREAIYDDKSKIRDHIMYQFMSSTEQVSINNEVSKSQLKEDFYRLLEIENSKNHWESSHIIKLFSNAHLYFDCTSATTDLLKLNKDFGYNYHLIKYLVKAHEKLKCEENTEIELMKKNIEKEEANRKQYENGSYDMMDVQAPKVEKIFNVVESLPSYPGGEEKLFEFIKENFVYPDSAKEKGIEGKVYAKFIVMEDGTLTDIKIARGIGGGCDEAVIDLIKKMPRWIPGEQRGKKVKVSMVLPVNVSAE